MASVLTNAPRDGAESILDSAPVLEETQPQQATSEIVKDLVKLFKLLADETRLKIVYLLLREAELNVRTLCKLLGQSQPAVSHHLAIMRNGGLIDSRRDGKHNFYHLKRDRFEALLVSVFETTPGETDQLSFENFALRFCRIGA